MEYLIISIVAVLFISGLNIVCFFIGAKVGQKVVKGEEVQLPNPIKEIREEIKEREEERAANKEQEMFETLAYNIDVYDGTGIGQKEIPN